MLNGIGGKTIEEAQSALKMSEMEVWRAYYYRFGSFNLSRHIRAESADIQLLSMAMKGLRRTPTRAQMLPHEYQQPEQHSESIEETLMKMSGAGEKTS